jgi:nucleoside-diphosphate-sugar epimerase
MNATLLVTGAQGFVGRWLVREALAGERFAHVAGTGRSARRDGFTHRATLGPHAVAAPLPPALRAAPHICAYAACDVRDEDGLTALLQRERPRAVVHLASALRDDPPSALFPVNVEGTLALLGAIARSGVAVERIVLGSSGSVYGAPAALPVRESDPLRPPDLYAVSKAAAEDAARIVARELGLPLIVARIFNVVGPGLDERHACARFASQLAAIAHGYSPPRVVVGDLTPTRDLVDVRDVAAALAVLAERGDPGETYNVASGRETPMQDVLDTLLTVAGLRERVEIARGYHRAADCPRVVADVSRTAALGCAPARALGPSLAELYAYYAETVAEAIASSPSSTPDASRSTIPASATAACATQG